MSEKLPERRRLTPRTRCRAVFLDAGGVIVLPDRHLVADALAAIGIQIDPAAVPRAHYRAVRALDARAGLDAGARLGPGTPYAAALFPQLGIISEQTAEALAAWERLGDRACSRRVLWSEPTPGALETIAALRRRGFAVVIVTNSDGHAEENLRDCGIPDEVPVIDSHVVGATKPDPRIFEAALAGAGIRDTDVAHVGDTLSADVAGARAAGITPIHFDPFRACRTTDHRHIRTLPGIWRHIAPAS
jgi:putative hydrolase of the HAD superfamily